MKVLITIFLFFGKLLSLHAQFTPTYFNIDIHFPTKQAWGKNVFITQQGYATIGGYAHDINIPGNFRKNEVIVFSSFNSFGDTLFTKKYDSPVYGWVAYSTITTNENKYISTGWKNLDTINYTQDSTVALLIKFDANGDTLWTKEYMYAPQKKSYGADIYQEADSGFVVCGITNKYSTNMRAMLLRLDKDGNVLWEKNYPNAGDVYAYSLAKAADGGYLLAGVQFGGGTSGVTDAYALKTDSLGNFMWSKLYGGAKGDINRSVVKTLDGGYIFTGGTIPVNDVWEDGVIRKINANGIVEWEKNIGNENDNAFDPVFSLSDGNYAVLGAYRDTINVNALNAWLVKFDINGNIHWQRFYNKYGGNNHNYFRDLKETPDKGFVIIGELTNLSLWQQNMWLIKLDSLGCDIANCSVGITEEMPNEFVFTLYPNPAQDVLHIETTYNKEQTILYIYDITGKEIRQTSIKSNYQQLNISTLPAGLYLCRLTQGDFNIKTIKLLKQ